MGQDPLADTAYLKRRRGKDRSGYRWYVRIVVPADLRDILRKQTIERALNTGDLKVAQRLKHAVVAQIFEEFERAKLGKITSADIEREAQRFAREQIELINKQPGTAFEPTIDDNDNNLGLGGDAALWVLREAQDSGDWPDSVMAEADDIARRHGMTLAKAQAETAFRKIRWGHTDGAPVFRSEGSALSWIKSKVANGTVVNADEAPAWNDLHARYEMKRINHQEAYSENGACTNWAESYFSRLRRAELGHHHHIAGPYLLRYAQEASWREDNRREANGDQVRQVAHLALSRKPSVDFSGYWQRHVKAG